MKSNELFHEEDRVQFRNLLARQTGASYNMTAFYQFENAIRNCIRPALVRALHLLAGQGMIVDEQADFPMALEHFDAVHRLPAENLDEVIAGAVILGTLLNHVQTVSQQMAPIVRQTVKAKHVFEEDDPEKPLDFSDLHLISMQSARACQILTALTRIPELAAFRECFLTSHLVLHPNTWHYRPPELADLDLSMNAEDFIPLAFLFPPDTLRSVYFREFFFAPFNHQGLNLITRLKEEHLDTLEYSLEHPVLERCRNHWKQAADAIIEFADNRERMRTGNKKPNQAHPAFQYHQEFQQSYNFRRWMQSYHGPSSRYIEERQVAGLSFVGEFLTSTRFQDNYSQIQQQIRPYIQEGMTALRKLTVAQMHRSSPKPFQSSGDFCPGELYQIRGGLKDPKPFEDSLLTITLKNRFNVFLLVDNSCSIGKNKQALMSRALVLLAEVIQQVPHMFHRLVCYAHHSSGMRGNKKLVTVRQTVDALVEEGFDPARLLHFDCRALNYDMFALALLLESYEDLLLGHTDGNFQNAVNLVIMLGDAWPVSYSTGDVKKEQRMILYELRSRYEFLLLYIATDQLYEPRDLHYDYFISLKSDEGFKKFPKKFTGILTEIYEKELA